ncbi:MAG: hypothetical protein K2P84_01155 [Undibacterium sp.]|nr:hypothetical protein [Undibacterium sp.]
MKTTEINALKILDLDTNIDLEKVVSFDAIDEESALLLIAKKELNLREEKGIGSFVITQPKGGQNFVAYLLKSGQVNEVLYIENEKFNIHSIQALPENRYLLTCARSEFRSDTDFDRNGRIYNSDGNLVENILLGDGIQDVQTSKDGTIWTSYFDEGVFGNHGWRAPIGAAGLRAWTEKGETCYEYSPMEKLDHIVDCYAINVSSDQTTWAYYYTDFPLVKIENKVIVDYWMMPVSGSSHFAIFKNFALLTGGYRTSLSLNLVHLLPDHKAKTLLTLKISNIDRPSAITCRGKSIFILEKSSVYLISLDDLLEKLNIDHNR